MPTRDAVLTLLTGAILLGCSSSTESRDLTIVAASGSLGAVAGDALALKVANGNADLPADATITWSGAPTVTALAPAGTAPSPLPAPGDAPTAVFVENPWRPDIASEIADVLFFLDPGKSAGGEVTVTATVGGSVTGTATISIPVGPTPAGDAAHGATLYGNSGVQCNYCHGDTGHGTDAGADGMYSYNNGSYPYPAPGLNAESGNLAGDPTWNAALLAVASRADVRNTGLTLRLPMATWLAPPVVGGTTPLTTQDFADIYAFLETQSQ
jgi:hypothetical protein